jgi:ubiquinone/menaquinone biosynthesis C-methylase UbiE
MTFSTALKSLWQTYVVFYIRALFSLLNFPALIYDYLFSRVLTRRSYLFMFQNNIKDKLDKISSVLDVGVGTGLPLHAIANQMTKTKIVGIDIDSNYISKAKTLFASTPHVEIREQNFYELASSNDKYDLIVFSSSFMLMPDRKRALDTAKQLLNKNGRIIFLLTLYENKPRYKIIEKIKPCLKYYTTVDFGTLVYETELTQVVQENGLEIVNKQRVHQRFNPLLTIFRFFCVECSVKS